MNKSFKGFGPHIWIIILLFGIACVGLVAAGFLSSVLNPEHVGAFIYAVGGLTLFYVMFNRYKKSRKDQTGRQDKSEDHSSTLAAGVNMDDSAGEKVRETIRKRKTYHKENTGKNSA